jgi:subtilisin family serine protease
VDITSTSLGYLTYDPPYPSWTWQNMDGNTTVITRAADMAVARGIVVLNSAGNNGYSSEHNTLNAPADGDSVLAVGAVTIDGQRAPFSSVGPTVDGRIKPDVMAQGVTVRCAYWDNPTQYTYSGGTSLSCPLAAGVAALLLHAKPSATPIEIASILKATASRAHAPDNLYGWGILDARKAIESVVPTDFALLQNYPNPFNSSTTLRYRVQEAAHVTIKIFDLLGREVRTVLNASVPRAIRTVEWDGTTSNGTTAASGIYFGRMIATTSSGRKFSSTVKMMLVR